MAIRDYLYAGLVLLWWSWGAQGGKSDACGHWKCLSEATPGSTRFSTLRDLGERVQASTILVLGQPVSRVAAEELTVSRLEMGSPVLVSAGLTSLWPRHKVEKAMAQSSPPLPSPSKSLWDCLVKSQA